MTTSNTNALLSHMSYMRRRANTLTRNATDAEDLVSDTVLKALEAWGRLSPDANIGAWLNCIMSNLHKDNRRNARHRPQATEADMLRYCAITAPEDQHRTLECKQALEATRKLSTHRQELLFAAALGNSYEEVVAEKNIRPATARSLNASSRKALHMYA